MRRLSKIKITGTLIYTVIFRVISLLPLIHIIYAAGSSNGNPPRGVTSVIFDISASALPRVETLGASFIYRTFLNEIEVYFIFPLVALIFGIVTKRLLSKS